MDTTSARGARPSIISAAVGAYTIAAVAALAFAGTPAQAAFPGLNGPIACGGIRGNDTDLEIFQVNPDGTGETLLTNNGFRDGSPSYSPDGSKIAFESQRNNVPGQPANTEIYVADNDGDLEGPDVKRLTFNNGLIANGTLSGTAATDFSPTWSPDGTEIAFHSGRLATFSDGGTTPATDFEIYKMSATTGESVAPATRLTNKRGQDAIPSWSPDGTKIAFQGFPAGNPPALNQNLEIFTMNPDGSGLTNVSNNPGTAAAPSLGLDRDVIWSPDSQQIAYNSARATTVPTNQNNDVWRANRDGSNPVRLTPDEDSPSPATFTDYDAPLVWSPDGKSILFASSFESPNPTTNDFFAYTMDAVTGDTGPASVKRVARVEQFQRCDWTTPRPVMPTPTPTPAPTPANPLVAPVINPIGGGVMPPPTRRKGTLSAQVTKADLRAPYRFTTSGRLTLPSGVAKSVGCTGRVSVQVKRGSATISTRRVALRRDCTYSLRVSFADARRFARLRQLKFTARFLGNTLVSPAVAPARFARVRR